VRRIGIDVGDTNTDAVLLQDVKTPDDARRDHRHRVTALAELASHPDVARRAIDGVVIGTMHFVNAVLNFGFSPRSGSRFLLLANHSFTASKLLS
jgi:N-methylhydantoinase A/oxoprolinase/acetone carboxylase beta subunit